MIARSQESGAERKEEKKHIYTKGGTTQRSLPS